MQKIIIFGYSGMGRFVQYSLDIKQYQVVAFLDNCEKIWNGENKIPILSPEKVKELEYDFIVISLAEYEEEMKRQLISYGVSEEKIITFMRLDLKWQEPRYAMMRNCMNTIIERNILGSMAELGVYKGEFSACLNQMLPDRKLYLFDTFEGFHNNDKNEKDTIILVVKYFAAYFLHGCASGGECSRRCGYGVGVCSWRECSYKEG